MPATTMTASYSHRRHHLRHRQQRQQPTTPISLAAQTLMHPDLGSSILSFCAAPALCATATVSSGLCELTSSDALWRALLVTERPQLRPLVLEAAAAGGGGGGGGSTKALYRTRMLKEDDNEEDADARVRQRLAEVFVEIRVVKDHPNKLVLSRVVPLGDTEAVTRLLGDGVGFDAEQDGEQFLELWFDNLLRPTMQLFDMGSETPGRLLEPKMWDSFEPQDDGDLHGLTCYCGDIYIDIPWEWAGSDDLVSVGMALTTWQAKGGDDTLVRVTVAPLFELFPCGRRRAESETQKLEMLEMLLDGTIRPHGRA